MWGIVYQGYNAVFPSFYPELFQNEVPCFSDGDLTEYWARRLRPCFLRCSQSTHLQDRPTSRSTAGAITFAITAVAAIAAFSARETYRLPVNDLGNPYAALMEKPDYAQTAPRPV